MFADADLRSLVLVYILSVGMCCGIGVCCVERTTMVACRAGTLLSLITRNRIRSVLCCRYCCCIRVHISAVMSCCRPACLNSNTHIRAWYHNKVPDFENQVLFLSNNQMINFELDVTWLLVFNKWKFDHVGYMFHWFWNLWGKCVHMYSRYNIWMLVWTDWCENRQH